MKKLDVPLILQEKGSVDCGATCVQMVLAYYGKHKTLQQLQSKLNYSKVGTSIYDNGCLLLQEGFHTTVVTAQPLLFPPEMLRSLKTDNDTLLYIQSELKRKRAQKKILKTFETYLLEGGQVTLQIPTFRHLKEAIDQDHPVIALMYAQSLGRNEGKYHFVVVSGYRDDEVFINNPWPESSRQSWFLYEQFIYGVYASTCVAVDNGTFLIAS